MRTPSPPSSRTAKAEGPKPPQPAVNADAGLAATLQQLAARVARENNKEAALQCVGFDAIPEDYRRAVKDIGVQAVRNAIVHGIESPAARLNAGKPRRAWCA